MLFASTGVRSLVLISLKNNSQLGQSATTLASRMCPRIRGSFYHPLLPPTRSADRRRKSYTQPAELQYRSPPPGRPSVALKCASGDDDRLCGRHRLQSPRRLLSGLVAAGEALRHSGSTSPGLSLACMGLRWRLVSPGGLFKAASGAHAHFHEAGVQVILAGG